MIKLPKLREGVGGWKMQKEKMFFFGECILGKHNPD